MRLERVIGACVISAGLLTGSTQIASTIENGSVSNPLSGATEPIRSTDIPSFASPKSEPSVMSTPSKTPIFEELPPGSISSPTPIPQCVPYGAEQPISGWRVAGCPNQQGFIDNCGGVNCH
jgi:hypothetical protein